MRSSTQISTGLRFDRPGKQADFLRVPYSSDRSAYGWIPVPALCAAGGTGPTLVLIAGNHGDEYEGQVALRSIARALDPEEMQGRVIIVPSINFPAVEEGTRTSPIDRGNLNRAFPGDPDGTPTAMIADYVESVLLPIADIVIDLHSGGRSLDHLPTVLARAGSTAVHRQRIRELASLFGAPYAVQNQAGSGGTATTLHAAAERHGVPAITAELGSGGTLDRAGLALAEAGIWRVLQHFGVVQERAGNEGATQFMQWAEAIYAMGDGLFEPFASIGDRVFAGQEAGLLHSLYDVLEEPVRLKFAEDGILACRRFPTLTRRGDCLFLLMREEGAD